jgi:peptide/nickel transport system substrate-binding protein
MPTPAAIRGLRGRSGRAACASLALVAALVGCSDRSLGEPGADTPVHGGTAVIAYGADLQFANSLVNTEVYTTEILQFALFMPLVRHDARLELEPYLARAWELRGDTGVVFQLRDDVYWHDGVRTTARDVAFTFERIKDPETGFPNAGFFDKWDAVEVIDSFTVAFRFQPHMDPLAGVPFTAIMPAHLLDTVPAAAMRRTAFNKQPVGNGPFRFVSQRLNDRWIFEANPDFPAELGGRPYLDRLVWRVIPENSAQLTALGAGTVDLILGPRSEQLARLDADPRVRAIANPSRMFFFIGWNTRSPHLADPRVRRALAHALDRRSVLDAARSGYGTLGVGPIAPFHWAFHRELQPLPHSLDSARTLLAQAGWSDRNGNGFLEDGNGTALAFSLSYLAGSAYHRDVAEMIRFQLEQAGVRMTSRPTEGATLMGDITGAERRFDAVLLSFSTDFRLDYRDNFHSRRIGTAQQLSSYANAEVDTLLDRAARALSREEARPLWYRFQEIMREEQPWTVLYYTPQLFAARERVKGMDMDIRGAFVNIARWWVDPGAPPGDAPGAPADTAGTPHEPAVASGPDAGGR